MTSGSAVRLFESTGPRQAGRSMWRIGDRCYVFLSQPPVHADLFIAINEQIDTSALIWIREPNNADWRRNALVVHLDAQGRTREPVELGRAGAKLHLSAGSRVLSDNNFTITLSGEAAFDSGAGASEMRPTEFRIHASNPGAVLFEVDSAQAAIIPSIRFFFGAEPSLSRLIYPIFVNPPGNGGTLRIALDPLEPYSGTVASATAPIREKTNYRTNLGHAFTLESIGSESGYAVQYDPVEDKGYWVLNGKWKLELDDPAAGESNRLMCGLSGIEGIGLDSQMFIDWIPGQPAYAPYYPAGSRDAASRLASSIPGIDDPVTTAWVNLTSARDEAPFYYAQPDKSPFYSVGNDPTFLQFLPLPGVRIPAPPDNPTGLPMVPYAGLDGEGLEEYQRFEFEILSPERRDRVYRFGSHPTLNSAANEEVQGATPQGLLLTMSGSTWRTLTFAQTSHGREKLEIAGPKQTLQNAFLTNQLFLVISSAALFEKQIESISAILTMDNFSFQFLPNDWSQYGTILIFKFYQGTLRKLASDLGAWTAPGVFNEIPSATLETLAAFIAKSDEHKDDPEFEYFLTEVLDRADWNGILVLNAKVPLSGLPRQLEGIAAGIDPSKFSAHHLGINITPVERGAGQKLQLSDSSLFGLIYYEDPGDLFDNGEPYQFKVLYLKVLFANSQVASFASQVELYVGQLFDERADLIDSPHGNNIILNGVYQNHNGESSYAFTWHGENLYKIQSKVLESLELTQAQFVTVLLPEQQTGERQTVSRFLLWGNLRFQALPQFDAFSFGTGGGVNGRLAFSNMSVRMEFPSASPDQRKFFFEAGDIAFDLGTSQARPDSLYARFPLTVVGLIQGGVSTGRTQSGSATPGDLGFMSVETPLGEGEVAVPWYGLECKLNLGGQGALATRANFEATLLAAWSPNPDRANVLMGIRLPGSSGPKQELTIQGPLKLSMKRIAFDAREDGGTRYVLQFNNLALNFFNVSFPRSGQTNLFLFGNPSNPSDRTTLGWYGAYVKDEEKAAAENHG
jgi:hypothetical protein